MSNKPHIRIRNGHWEVIHFISCDKILVAQALAYVFKRNATKYSGGIYEGPMPRNCTYPRRTIEIDKKTLDIKIPVFPGYVR